MPNVTLSCERICPETNQIGKNGKKKRIVIFVRKMRISGSFIGTTAFEVNYLKRNGEFRFYVKSLVSVKDKWQTLKLGPTTGKVKWKSEGSYAYDEFMWWLNRLGVPNASSLTSELLTMPPENLEAA